MSDPVSNITIPVDLTNPGQFFACCGLLELADRFWPGAEGWFEDRRFLIAASSECSLSSLLDKLAESAIANTMTPAQCARLKELSAMKKKQREATPGLEDEKKMLDGLRRKEPIVLTGPLSLRIDWFCDAYTQGFALKTWAGRQSVLDIASDMFAGFQKVSARSRGLPWTDVRDVGLPFNFDSDLGAQGSALDVGFSFDKLLDGGDATRINRGCRPALELLCFIGLQRFRPREIPQEDRFLYLAWAIPLPPSVASAAVSLSIYVPIHAAFEFRMFQRTEDYYSFYPAIRRRP